MSTQYTPQTPLGQYLSLIDDCNRVTSSDVRAGHEQSNASCHTFAEHDLVKLLLRGSDNIHHEFGYLTREIANSIPWPAIDFKRMSARNNDVVRDISNGPHANVAGRLLSLVRMKAVSEALPIVSELDATDPVWLPIMGGHAKLKVPERLGYVLGIKRHRVHLLLYTGTGSDIRVLIRRRDEGSYAYPTAYEETFTSTIKYGETEEDVFRHLISDAKGQEGTGTWTGAMETPVRHDPVSYLTIGGHSEDELLNLVDASVVTCYSIEVERDQLRKLEDRGGWYKFTLIEIKRLLHGRMWAPGSALAMLRFFIDKEVISHEDGSEMILRRLNRPLPHA